MFFCCCCCKKLFFTHPAIQLTKMKEITSHPKQAHPSQTPRNPASKRSMVKSPQPLFDRKPPKVEVENKEICLHRSLRTVTLAKVNYAVDKNLFFWSLLNDSTRGYENLKVKQDEFCAELSPLVCSQQPIG